jgi:hypothetical protein
LLDDQLFSNFAYNLNKRHYGEAVGSGIVANQTLGYFMARTQIFLLTVRPDCPTFAYFPGGDLGCVDQEYLHLFRPRFLKIELETE